MRTRAGAAVAMAVVGMLTTGAAASAGPFAAPRTERPAGPVAAAVADAVGASLEARPAPARPLQVEPRLPDPVPGVLLVTTAGAPTTRGLTSGVGRAVRGATATAIGARVARVAVPAGSERAAAAVLQAQPGVVAVEPALYRAPLRAPDDPLYPRQWAHQLTDAEAGWDVTVGSSAVTVAVIDTGVDGRHPDLQDNVQSQRVFAGGSSYGVTLRSDNRRCSAADGGDHGTHVAGIAGARGDDGLGVAGVAWTVGLLDYAVFTPVNGGCAASDADVLSAVRAATVAGADVVNLSLGGAIPEQACSTAFQAVVDEARAAGTIVVAASGNAEQQPGAAGQAGVPASCNGVISVGAVAVDGSHAPYSTTNRYVDLVAPGGDSSTGFANGIVSTVGDGGHDWLEGTSMAAPYVAGLAALLRSVDPDLTPDEVEALMETTATDLGSAGRDPVFGWGLVDVGEAVALAAGGARPTPAPDPDFPVGDGSGDGLEPPPSSQPEVYRVAVGAGTTSAVPQAVAMSQVVFADQGATHAVLARRDVFADALAGSSLTLGYGPLLFSGSTGPLPAASRGELQRVLPTGSTVYLLGGTAALPAALEDELRALGFRPVRIFGQTREATAVEVAEELAVRRAALGIPDPGVVMLATGGNWPDAVTAGSLGAYYGVPILVTPTASLHAAPAQLLRTLRPEALLVLGGTAAVSDRTYSAAASAAGTGSTSTFRVAGSDRYGTAVAVADLFESLLAGTGVSPRCVLAVNVVRADAWAYALSASSLAGAYGCVMVPVHGPTGDRLPDVTRGYVDGFGVDGVLAGDTDVISDAAASDLRQLLQLS